MGRNGEKGGRRKGGKWGKEEKEDWGKMEKSEKIVYLRKIRRKH